MLSELQVKIIEYISGSYGNDGIDIAHHFQIPIDVSYKEIDMLITSGWLKKEHIGIGTILSVVAPKGKLPQG